MAAPSRLPSLRVLSRTTGRHIHSSSTAPSPSTLLASSSRHAAYLPRTVADLRSECKRRDLISSGRKSDLVQRLAANDALHSRGFESATNQVSKRPTVVASLVQSQTASFNTSQALRRVGDDSTIDFAFLPRIHEKPPPRQDWIKVPFLPDNFEPSRTQAHQEPAETVIRPEIVTVAHGSTHVHAPSAMSEVVDNTSIQIDPFELTEQVSDAAARSATKGATASKKGMSDLRYLWNGLLDDIFGPAKKS